MIVNPTVLLSVPVSVSTRKNAFYGLRPPPDADEYGLSF